MKKVAEEYQTIIGECGLEVFNFGVTWNRTHKDGNILKSSLDHALTNKPNGINDYYKTLVDFSDHSMISVDLKIKVPKQKAHKITSRDLRKVRNNPKLLQTKLAGIKWESLSEMSDIDEMENFWTSEINKCLDLVAPFKTRKVKKKKFTLPKHVQGVIQIRRELQEKHDGNIKTGKIDFELEKQLKKHSNYCNKVIKKAVQEETGKYVTKESSIKEIWSSIKGILNPDNLTKNSLKIQIDDQLIQDPLKLVEHFNVFFKEKVENLATGIKKD